MICYVILANTHALCVAKVLDRTQSYVVSVTFGLIKDVVVSLEHSVLILSLCAQDAKGMLVPLMADPSWMSLWMNLD